MRLASTCIGWPQTHRQAGQCVIVGTAAVAIAQDFGKCTTCIRRMASALL